jgi:hypothetical protein
VWNFSLICFKLLFFESLFEPPFWQTDNRNTDCYRYDDNEFCFLFDSHNHLSPGFCQKMQLLANPVQKKPEKCLDKKTEQGRIKDEKEKR